MSTANAFTSHFHVYIPDYSMELDHPYIDKFQFKSDLYSLYNKCAIRIKDTSQVMFNYIAIGLKVNVDILSEDSSTTYTNKMRVLTFKKVPSKEPMIDYIDVTLISDWYFDDTIVTSAWEGNVGTIYSTIFSKKFLGSFLTDFSASTDLSRYRYQLGETTGAFVQRILKYSTKNNLPMYLYSDPQGYLKFKSVYDMVTTSPETVLVTEATENNFQLESDFQSLNRKMMKSYESTSDCSALSSKTTITFSYENFVSDSEFPTGYVGASMEQDNPQSMTTTPPTQVYTSWSLTPNDAFSIASKENFESNANAFNLVCSLSGCHVNSLNVGNNIAVSLPYTVLSTKTGRELKLGSGLYLCKRWEFFSLDNIETTRLTLIQTSY